MGRPNRDPMRRRNQRKRSRTDGTQFTKREQTQIGSSGGCIRCKGSNTCSKKIGLCHHQHEETTKNSTNDMGLKKGPAITENRGPSRSWHRFKAPGVRKDAVMHRSRTMPKRWIRNKREICLSWRDRFLARMGTGTVCGGPPSALAAPKHLATLNDLLKFGFAIDMTKRSLRGRRRSCLFRDTSVVVTTITTASATTSMTTAITITVRTIALVVTRFATAMTIVFWLLPTLTRLGNLSQVYTSKMCWSSLGVLSVTSL